MNNNNKAFTMVELLGILVLLSVIALVVFPNIVTTIKLATDKEYDRFTKELSIITENYIDKNNDKLELSEPGDVIFIELGDLVESGYLNRKTINPKTKNKIDLNTTILVTVLNDYTKHFEYTGTKAAIHNYEIDNLKIMYDGYKKIEQDGNLFIWKDIMGNNDGRVINGSGVEDWSNYKIILGRDNNYISAHGSSSLIPVDSEITVEIVYEGIDQKNKLYLNNRGLGFYYFNLYDDGMIRSMVRNSADTANYWPQSTDISLVQPNKVHTLSVTVKKNGNNFDFNYFGNGKTLVTLNKTGQKHSSLDFTIGKDYTTDSSPVYIHGFRLYDKALNAEQIKNNHKIDMNRYNWRGK